MLTWWWAGRRTVQPVPAGGPLYPAPARPLLLPARAGRQEGPLHHLHHRLRGDEGKDRQILATVIFLILMDWKSPHETMKLSIVSSNSVWSNDCLGFQSFDQLVPLPCGGEEEGTESSSVRIPPEVRPFPLSFVTALQRLSLLKNIQINSRPRNYPRQTWE